MKNDAICKSLNQANDGNIDFLELAASTFKPVLMSSSGSRSSSLVVLQVVRMSLTERCVICVMQERTTPRDTNLKPPAPPPLPSSHHRHRNPHSPHCTVLDPLPIRKIHKQHEPARPPGFRCGQCYCCSECSKF